MARLSAVSARRVEANRRNAPKSTGPRTVAGKARSARNAVTHGIFCSDAVVQDEDRGVFETLRAELIDEHRPQTITELFLVDRMAIGMWRLRRVQAAEEIAHAAAAEEMVRVRQEAIKRQRDQDDDDDAMLWAQDEDDIIDGDVDGDDVESLSKPPPLLGIPLELEHADTVAASVTTYGLMVPRDGQRQTTLERLSLYEKRIEGTVHRCMRDLRKLRTPAKNERVPAEASPWAEEVLGKEDVSAGHPATDAHPAKPLSPTLSPGRGERAQALAGEGTGDAGATMKNEPIDATVVRQSGGGGQDVTTAAGQ